MVEMMLCRIRSASTTACTFWLCVPMGRMIGRIPMKFQLLSRSDVADIVPVRAAALLRQTELGTEAMLESLPNEVDALVSAAGVTIRGADRHPFTEDDIHLIRALQDRPPADPQPFEGDFRLVEEEVLGLGYTEVLLELGETPAECRLIVRLRDVRIEEEETRCEGPLDCEPMLVNDDQV